MHLLKHNRADTMHICKMYANIAVALCAVDTQGDIVLYEMQRAYKYAVEAHDGKHALYNTDALVDALNEAYDDDSFAHNADESMARKLAHIAIDALNGEDWTGACNVLAQAILQRAYSVDMLYA